MAERSSSSNSSTYAQIIGPKPKRPKSFRKTKHTLDCISSLPDSILHHILSFLPTEDAIKTSVLSKSWNRLWTFASDLSFHNRRGIKRVRDFVAFVRETLNLYSCVKLDKFLIDFEYSRRYSYNVNKWVRFTTTHKVENLYLEFHGTEKANTSRPSPALTELRLYNFVLQGENNFAFQEISPPNLLFLSISGFMYKRKFQLTNVLSLVEAKLSFECKSNDDGRNSSYLIYRNDLRELLLKLLHVPKLTISTWCLQVLTMLEVKTWLPPLAKRKSLVLDTQLDKWNLPGIANLLQSSPYLEKLVINLVPSYNSDLEFSQDFIIDNNFDHEENWKSQNREFGCLSRHLKTVEIVGFEAKCFGVKYLTGLVQFLLKHARVLEKLVIYGKAEVSNQTPTLLEACRLCEVTSLFLSYQRSSPNAVVMFS
nr:putative f-box protein [Quercus suber]